MIKNEKFYLTYIIIAINVLICILMFLVDKSFNFDVYTLIRFGAKHNFMIVSGEFYRLITTTFLHSDLTHLLFNMYALFVLGKNIEFVYGKVKFMIIYLGAGIFGTLGSFIFSKSIAVGASGAIFGLLGAYIYLYISRPDVFNAKFLKNLLSVIAINLVFGIVVPNIDNWAHICGLVGGLLVSWAVGTRGQKTFSTKKIMAQILTIVLMCTFLVGGIQLNKSSWEYNQYRGEVYLDENKIDEAHEQFTIGLSKNPDIEVFHYYLGCTNLLKGDTEKAQQHFEKAIEINPNLTQAKEILDKINKK